VGIEARNAGLGRLLNDTQMAEAMTRAQWAPKYASYRPGSPLKGD